MVFQDTGKYGPNYTGSQVRDSSRLRRATVYVTLEGEEFLKEGGGPVNVRPHDNISSPRHSYAKLSSPAAAKLH